MSHKKIEENYAVYLESLFELISLGKQDDRITTLLDELSVYFWMHDDQYSVVYANQAVNEIFGRHQGRKCYEYFMGEKNICSCCQSKIILEGGRDTRCTQCKRSNHNFDINIYHIPLVSEDSKKYIIKSNLQLNVQKHM